MAPPRYNNSNDPKNKYKDLPLVPETILKRRHDLDEKRRQRAAEAKAGIVPGNRKKGSGNNKKGVYVKKLESLVALGKSRKHTQTRYNRVLKKGMQTRASNKPVEQTEEIEVEPADADHNNKSDTEQETKTVTYQSNSVGAPMVFVIRVRDHHGANAMVKRALSRLRLRHINEGVFLRYDESHRKLLHLVEPWVVYGPPVRGVVEDLVHRRGFGKVQNKRVALSDNTIIEQELGNDCGVICVEDIVHEIVAVGDGFAKVSGFLWPFRLSHKMGHFERETLKFTLGKDYGDKGERINNFIKQML